MNTCTVKYLKVTRSFPGQQGTRYDKQQGNRILVNSMLAEVIERVVVSLLVCVT